MNETKEVRYDLWCSRCKNSELDESKDPCWYCLDEPVNVDSHKPLYFEEETNAS